MKIFIIQDLGYVYNDSYHERRGQDYDIDSVNQPIKAYRSFEMAMQESARLSATKLAEEQENCSTVLDQSGNPLTSFYRVVEVEAPDEEIEAYDYAAEKANRARADAQCFLKPALLKKAAALFEKWPQLESFGWRQFTDYFNDGDPCTFGVYSDDPLINGESYYDLKPRPEENLLDEVAQLVNSLSTHDLKAVFGDHVEVTVKRDLLIKTSSYTQHD